MVQTGYNKIIALTHIQLVNIMLYNLQYSALYDPTTSYAGAQITQYQFPAEQAFNLLRDTGNSVSFLLLLQFSIS